MDVNALDTSNGTIMNEDDDILLFMCAFLYPYYLLPIVNVQDSQGHLIVLECCYWSAASPRIIDSHKISNMLLKVYAMSCHDSCRSNKTRPTSVICVET